MPARACGTTTGDVACHHHSAGLPPLPSHPWSWMVLGRPTRSTTAAPPMGSPTARRGSARRPSATSATRRSGGAARSPSGCWCCWALGPRLARRCRAGRPGRRLPALVPLPGAHHLRLLRGRLRALGGARRHLLPGPGARPSGRTGAAAPDRCAGGRQLCVHRVHAVLVLLPAAVRPGRRPRAVVGPDVAALLVVARAQSVLHPSLQPVAEPATQPVAQPLDQPVTAPVAQPVVEPASVGP